LRCVYHHYHRTARCTAHHTTPHGCYTFATRLDHHVTTVRSGWIPRLPLTVHRWFPTHGYAHVHTFWFTPRTRTTRLHYVYLHFVPSRFTARWIVRSHVGLRCSVVDSFCPTLILFRSPHTTTRWFTTHVGCRLHRLPFAVPVRIAFLISLLPVTFVCGGASVRTLPHYYTRTFPHAHTTTSCVPLHPATTPPVTPTRCGYVPRSHTFTTHRVGWLRFCVVRVYVHLPVTTRLVGYSLFGFYTTFTLTLRYLLLHLFTFTLLFIYVTFPLITDLNVCYAPFTAYVGVVVVVLVVVVVVRKRAFRHVG